MRYFFWSTPLLFVIGFFYLCYNFLDPSYTTPISYNGRIRPIEAYSKLKYFESLNNDIPAQESLYQNAFDQLTRSNASGKQIQQLLESRFPLKERLKSFGDLLKILPGKFSTGEWFSLHALKAQIYDPGSKSLIPIGNFTLFSDTEFENIRKHYLEWENDYMNSNSNSKNLQQIPLNEINSAYERLIKHSDQLKFSKKSVFPSPLKLKLEALYYHYPFIEIVIGLYGIAALCLILNLTVNNRPFYLTGLFFLVLAFLFHTAILALRCYILNRPPVSNMFETVIYVPWVAVLISFIFNYFSKKNLILIASAIGSCVLLILLKMTEMSSSLENVQPVLNSQFWLIIHVLMVVGSYGVFVLGGLLGHIYLGSYLYLKKETSTLQEVGKLILQTMYLGTTMLIIGTILGGVWAAESWGRFWDWDPKESWAFISSCIYLIWIHLYRFHKIGYFGIAAGSICGLLAISFTWYGVNYILGTGLHSYGFGKGGQVYYYLFLCCELIFVAYAMIVKRRVQRIVSKKVELSDTKD